MKTVLAVGVAVIDFVMSVDAFPRTAEKLRAKDAAIVGGGCAANAAVAVARLGGRAMLAARLGRDEIGDLIASGLDREGVDCALVRRLEDGRSSFSSVYVDAEGERQIVNFRDMGLSFDAQWLAESLPDHFDAALADTRWPQGAAVAMQAARARGVAGILDAEPSVHEAEDAVALASHIAFSAAGLRTFCGVDDPHEGLRRARARTSAWVAYTDGAKGAFYLEGDALRHVPSFPVEVVDSLGAGDVWHGAFTLAMAEGRGEAAAMRFANAVAAIKCTRFGGRLGTPDRRETEEFLASH
ncbi:PfkB family carbohydrate kinase [Mesorhizobium xinjiangense]|uniref:PfkB family carbohydrate kinase n=1 Tax=Mesorhizobium xinjiangense TaxID=2678685 RepID=UPI0012EE59C1|nr:PfkB family carbohydrate kinase [Mesorhizobium xinjiangense]